MEPRHARYPFLEASRDAVEAAGVDVAEVVADPDHPAVERGRERVERAVNEGTVGDPHRRTRIELLSYPIARVLVSLVDQPVLVRRYARAEARTAKERFVADIEEDAQLQSTAAERLTLETLLREFDLASKVTRSDPATSGAGEPPTGQTATGSAAAPSEADRIRIDVGAYLELASGLNGDGWRLVNRSLADGSVPVTREELHTLLGEAVRARIGAELPLSVPDEIADRLHHAVSTIEEELSDLQLSREIDTVVPDLFPPCMEALLDHIRKGEDLPHHSRFAITAFLTSIGMSTDDVVEIYGVNSTFGEQMTRYQTEHIRGETGPTAYSPPSCATMQTYGDCVNMDDLCEQIAHPLAYYERRLETAGDDELVDWRDGEADA